MLLAISVLTVWKATGATSSSALALDLNDKSILLRTTGCEDRQTLFKLFGLAWRPLQVEIVAKSNYFAKGNCKWKGRQNKEARR